MKKNTKPKNEKNNRNTITKPYHKAQSNNTTLKYTTPQGSLGGGMGGPRSLLGAAGGGDTNKPKKKKRIKSKKEHKTKKKTKTKNKTKRK